MGYNSVYVGGGSAVVDSNRDVEGVVVEGAMEYLVVEEVEEVVG